MGGIGALVLFVALFVSVIAIITWHLRLQSSLEAAPRLEPETTLPDKATVSVVIPAYNEAENIADCVTAVLASDIPDSLTIELIVADDESTDDTVTRAKAAAGHDDRVTIFTVPPRPTDTPWRGKNWACSQAVKKATGDYLLFIDADVRLEKTALRTALSSLHGDPADLLSCGPNIICDCFSEWLVQPIMIQVIAIGFNFEPVNDPEQPAVALAAGPFMFFRRSAYDAIGGHAAVASDLVEDVALARCIKAKGLRLRYVLGLDDVNMRMYRSFWALWEGWTKNYYSGSGLDLKRTLFSAFAIAEVFTVPWAGLVVSVWQFSVTPVGTWALLLVLSSLAVGMQLYMRFAAARVVDPPPRYWWLGWLGGGVVSAIAVASIIKTETGWGWTWRGRSLADAGAE